MPTFEVRDITNLPSTTRGGKEASGGGESAARISAFTIFFGLERMTTGPGGGCGDRRRLMASALVLPFSSMTLMWRRTNVATMSAVMAAVGTMKMPMLPRPFIHSVRSAATKIRVLPAPQASCAHTSMRSTTRAEISLNWCSRRYGTPRRLSSPEAASSERRLTVAGATAMSRRPRRRGRAGMGGGGGEGLRGARFHEI